MKNVKSLTPLIANDRPRPRSTPKNSNSGNGAENPRVGGSIPPLATIFFNNLQNLCLVANPFCVSFAWVCVSPN